MTRPSLSLGTLLGLWFLGYAVLVVLAVWTMGSFGSSSPDSQALSYAALLVAAGVLTSVTVFKVVRHTDEPRLGWKLAVAAVQVACGSALAVVCGFGLYLALQMDPARTNSNVAIGLHRDARYPLVGYWKTTCDSTFGMAIDHSHPASYSVAFCFPSMCTASYPWAVDTQFGKIVPFRTVDANTIAVTSEEQSLNFSRCQ